MTSHSSPRSPRSPHSPNVSTERTVEALTWLRKFLTSQTSASTAASLTSGLAPTSTAVSTIEKIRPLLEEQVAATQHASTNALEQGQRHQTQSQAWEAGGALKLLAELEVDAVAEFLPLCNIAVALQLGPYESVTRGGRVAAAGELVEKYLRMEDWVEGRKECLAEAQAGLREACALRGRADRGIKEAKEGVESRKEQAERDQKKKEKLVMKKKEYDGTAAEWRERVRRGGVAEWCRHEAVVKAGRELVSGERKLQEVRAALKKYEGLPADLTGCEEIAVRLRAEIATVDCEISEVISSMSR